MNFMRSTPRRLMSSGGTTTSPCGHKPTQSCPFPAYGAGGSPVGGRGPPGGVTGQALSARLGWAEPVVELLPTEPLDDGVFELPIEQAAVPSTRHPIRNALRTLRLAPGTPVPEDGTESRTSSTSSSSCLTRLRRIVFAERGVDTVDDVAPFGLASGVALEEGCDT